jgi:hypothetical protein
MSFHGAPDEVLTIPTARDAGVATSFAAKEPMIGYRAWLVEPRCDGFELRGVLAPVRWASTPNAWTAAVCRPEAGTGSPLVRHDQVDVPHPDCTCGLHAYHSLSIGGYDDRLVPAVGWDVGIVWGAVVGAGRVLTYGDGWRAQFARPVAMLQGSGLESHVRGVARQLGIPVVSKSGIARVAVEFGRPGRILASPSRVRLDV